MFSSFFSTGRSSVSTQAADSSSNNQQCLQVNESLYELHRPLGIPTVQVVFFHGLQLGDYNNAHWSTWQSEDGSCIWPKTWLVEDIPGAHVLSVLYGQSLRNMHDAFLDPYIIAENLLFDLLQRKVGQESNCPVVLVGHSFGGLVIKHLFCQAYRIWFGTHGSEKVALEAFLKSVTGIFYYSTPHQGSPIAEQLASVLGHSPMLSYFKTLNRDSACLSFEFDAIWKPRSLAGVAETCETDLGPGFQGIVAPEASTRRGVGVNFNLVEGADHFSICRPRDKFVRNFLKLKEFVVEATAHFRSPAARNDELIQSKLPNSVEGLIKGLLHSLAIQNESAVQVHLATLANRAYYHDPSRVAIANENGMVELLAKLLKEQHSGIMQEATRLIFCLTPGKEDDWIKSKILQEDGVLAAVVKFLSVHGKPYFEENATLFLTSLVSGNEAAKEATTNEPGAIAGLVTMLSKQIEGNTLRQAARALKTLATSHAVSIKSKIGVEEGATAGLVECLSVQDKPGLQEGAAGTLANLAAQYGPHKVTIAKEPRAIRALVKLLSKQNNGDARTAAARALRNLASSEVISIKSKIGNGGGALAGLVECFSVEDKPGSQEGAAGALADPAVWYKPNRVAIANEPAAIVGLVTLLSKQIDGDTRRQVATALGNLAISESNSIKSKIGNDEGAIVGLVECLSVQHKPDLQKQAAGALGNLAARYRPNEVAIANKPGAIRGLVKLLSHEHDGNARSEAAAGLRNLAGSEAIWIKSKIRNEEGAVAGLVECLSVKDMPDLQERAAGALRNLAVGNEPNQVAIANEPGAIRGLVKLLSQENNGNARREAAAALRNLADSEAIWIKSKISDEEGAVVGLVKCLSVQDKPDLQECAAGALHNLAVGNEEKKVAIANEPGAIRGLVKLSQENTGNARSEAAAALRNLADSEAIWIKSKISKEERAVVDLVECSSWDHIEPNSRYRERLDAAPKVQATLGKIYLCGNPEVGKTTLLRTLQRSFWESVFWESVFTLFNWPRSEERTRGINVSELSIDDKKPDEDPITLLVWDMAGQEDFHLVHNAFFPDLGHTEGNATTFIVVCSSEHSVHTSREQLEYWLRYIASSCGKTIQNPRHVFVVMNNIGGGREIHKLAPQWKLVLEYQREKFEQHLQIHTNLFLMDVRKFREVDGFKRCVVEHSRNLLRNQEVPNICDAIQKNLSVLRRGREQFPVLHWTEFVEQVVELLHDPWPEQTIEAAVKYLNEAGVVIYIDKEGVRLIVVDPNWFCRDVVGEVFLPSEMVSSTKDLFRTSVDQTRGSISISDFKKFFKSSRGEWNDVQVDNLITILLWLGLCYKGNYKNIFLPVLIAERGTPGEPWCLGTPVSHGADQWVMGFSVGHQTSDVTLAPISLWHRFQVDLAQTLEFNGHRKADNDFVAHKYFVTFVVDHMNVLIEVDANLDKPTFKEINILVKPRFKREQMDAAERKQCQVDLANDLVERLLKIWLQVCPGVEYEQKVIWPWPASSPRPEDRSERNVKVEEVKKWVQQSGLGRKMHWAVGSDDPITEDQLLSTKDKRDLLNHQFAQTSRTSGIEGHAREVNDSLFELYSPGNNPKIQVVFFHGLQMGEYSDQHLAAWQNEDGTIWPQTWLKEEISGVHVLSVSYSGGLSRSSNGTVDMHIIGENLLSDLIPGGVGQVPHCPVVLVGHSIGGLVIKDLCRQAHNKFSRCGGSERAKLEMFLKNIGGIFYYATPHRGSEFAEILAMKISTPLLTYFKMLSNETARLNSEFEAICKEKYKGWLFAGLGEGLPTNLGQLKPGVEPIKYFVVPEASARGDNFNLMPGADHFSVCRPRSKKTRSFSKLKNFISRIAREASDAGQM